MSVFLDSFLGRPLDELQNQTSWN